MEKKKTHHAWFVMIGCAVISFVGMGLVLNTVGLYFPSIIKDFNVGSAQVSVFMTVMALGMIIAMPIAGILLAKMNLKVLLSICAVFVGGGLFLCSLATSLIPLYIGALLIGLGASLLPGMLNGVVLGNWFSKKLGLVLGIVTSVSGVGGAIFNPLMSMVIRDLGWQSGYRISSVIVLVAILPVIWLFMRFAPGNGESAYGAEIVAEQSNGATAPIMDGMTFKEAVRSPLFYLILISGGTLAVQSGLVQQISSHVTSIGFEITVAGSVMSGVMIGTAVGKLLLGVLIDTLKKPAYALLIYMVLGAAGWTGLVLLHSQLLMIVCGFLLGTAQAIMLVAFPFVSRKVFGGKEFSRINSIHNMVNGLVPAVSIVGLGAIFDKTGSFNTPFIIGSAMVVASIIFMIASLAMSAKRNTKAAA